MILVLEFFSKPNIQDSFMCVMSAYFVCFLFLFCKATHNPSWRRGLVSRLYSHIVRNSSVNSSLCFLDEWWIVDAEMWSTEVIQWKVQQKRLPCGSRRASSAGSAAFSHGFTSKPFQHAKFSCCCCKPSQCLWASLRCCFVSEWTQILDSCSLDVSSISF